MELKIIGERRQINSPRIKHGMKINICGHTRLSPPGMELRGSKDWYVSNIILYRNRKVDSLSGWMLPKLQIISKNCSNKSCSELNFIQKGQWTYVHVGLERLICFEYYITLKWESRFSSGLNAAKYALYHKMLPKGFVLADDGCGSPSTLSTFLGQ